MALYLGIDWSAKKHDLACLNESGAVLARLTFPHNPDGFLYFDQTVRKLGAAPGELLVGLETAHNLLIDFLWAHDYTQVYVIPPSVVKSSRGRYGHSGAHTDQSDAQLIADLLRTDRARLHPWHPDSLLTRQLRAKVSLCQYLTRSILQCANRLRAILGRYYPAALNVFSDIATPIALEFLRTYPTPSAAAGLTWAEFQAFVARYRYPKPDQLPRRFARLQEPQPLASNETVEVYTTEAVQLAGLLLELVHAKRSVVRELHTLFEHHPDAPIFGSLPRAGDLLAPALLVKFGDDRQRFPTPESVQALAGTCPVTESSGKRKVIKFRHACDREFRQVAQQFARLSVRESTWASAYLEQARRLCASESHSYRCLANRWLAIIWKLWQTRQPYDETYHLKQRAAHSQPRV